MKKAIHICYALHDAGGHFTKFLGTSLLSVLDHASGPACIHILLDRTVSEENRARLQAVVDAYDQQLVFHEMDALFARPLRRLQLVRPDIARGRCTVATYYRLFLPSLLSGERVLYLDADTVVTCDLRTVYDGCACASGLAARPEPIAAERLLPSSQGVVTPVRYFNAGVLLFDFARLQGAQDGTALTQRWLDFLAGHPTEPYNDQDLLNHFYSETYEKLPPAAHMLVPERQMQGLWDLPPGLYHFDAMSLCMFRPDDVYDRLFFTYFVRTPWCDADFLLRAFSAIRCAVPDPVPVVYGVQLLREL